MVVPFNMIHHVSGINSLSSPSTSSQSLSFWLTSSCSCHIIFLCPFNSLIIHNSGLNPSFSQTLPNLVSLPPPGLPPWSVRLLDNSRIRKLADCQLAYWTTRGLDNSRTGQVVDWTTRGCHRQLCVLSFCSFGGICDCELSSPWVYQFMRRPVRELAIRKLSHPDLSSELYWPSVNILTNTKHSLLYRIMD